MLLHAASPSPGGLPSPPNSLPSPLTPTVAVLCHRLTSRHTAQNTGPGESNAKKRIFLRTTPRHATPPARSRSGLEAPWRVLDAAKTFCWKPCRICP